MPGVVYILTHPAMDGLIKIGRAHDLAERMRTLYNSSVPAPFACYYAARVGDMEAVEDDLHEIFGDRRINPRREFFTADPHRVARALRNHVSWLEDVVDAPEQEPEDIDATNKAEGAAERRANVDFETLGIPVGAELTFAGREEITCRVVQLRPPRVEYNGKILSLSAAAQKVLGVEYGVNGTLYWMYQGETISAHRDGLGRA